MNHNKKLNKKEIGLQLYHLIEGSKLSYKEIADFLELSSSRVLYDWFSGTKLPSAERLYNLLFVLLNVQ